MINVNDIKNGMTLIIEGNIYQVVEFLHVKPGKGSAFMKTKLKNMRTGGIVERTFNTNVKFEKANISRTNVQYLYNTGDTYYFMNMETYEQVELTKDQLGDDVLYLKGLNAYVDIDSIDLGNESITVGLISVSFKKICSITFVSALVPISSNFFFSSFVKSFEDKDFPSILSTLSN